MKTFINISALVLLKSLLKLLLGRGLRRLMLLALGFFMSLIPSESHGQIPVVDILNGLIETVEGVMGGQELLSEANENIVLGMDAENQRRILLQMRKMNEMYRSVNPLIDASGFSDMSEIESILSQFSTDLTNYLDVDDIESVEFGTIVTDLMDMSVDDLYALLDHDVIDQSAGLDNYDDMSVLFNASRDKKILLEKFAKKYKLQSSLAKYQLASEYDLKAAELTALLDGKVFRTHTVQGMISDMLDMVPTLVSASPQSASSYCNQMSDWEVELSAVQSTLAGIEAELASALEANDFSTYQVLFEEKLILENERQILTDLMASCMSYNPDISENVEDAMEMTQDIMYAINDVMSILGMYGDLEESAEEAVIKMSDGERIKLLDMRNSYIDKAMGLRSEAAELLREASESSDLLKSELMKEKHKMYNDELSKMPNVGF